MPKQVLLDSSFILSCVRNKIDFFDDLMFLGFEILIPRQVFSELDGITRSKQKLHNRDDAFFALKILEQNQDKFTEIDLKSSNVDFGILNYAKQHKDIIIATLDSELKKKIPNQKLVIREKKRLEVV